MSSFLWLSSFFDFCSFRVLVKKLAGKKELNAEKKNNHFFG